MTRIYSWLVDKLSRTLEPDERDAVRGDFAEAGVSGRRALSDLLGLVLRRQAGLWREWRPWLALVALVAPLGVILPFLALKLGMSWWTAWDNAEHWTWLRSGEQVVALACASVALVLWAWTSGFALGSLARSTVWVQGVLFSLALLGCGVWLVLQLSLPKSLPPVSLIFQAVLFLLTSIAVLFLLPSIRGVRWGLRIGALSVRQTIPLAASVVTTTALMIWMVTLGARSTNWLHVLLPFVVVCWPTVYIVATTGWQGRLENMVKRDSI